MYSLELLYKKSYCIEVRNYTIQQEDVIFWCAFGTFIAQNNLYSVFK